MWLVTTDTFRAHHKSFCNCRQWWPVCLFFCTALIKQLLQRIRTEGISSYLLEEQEKIRHKKFQIAVCFFRRPWVRVMYISYNQLQKYLRHCTAFWHKWPVHDLVLVIPPSPLIKVASNTRPYSKLGGTTLNGREEGGQHYISQTCDQERFEARKVVFSWECLNIFASGCSRPFCNENKLV